MDRTAHQGQRVAETEQGLSWVMTLTLLTLVTPISITVGGQLLTPSRVLFLVLVPVLMMRLVRGQYGGIKLLDYCIFLNVVWMFIAIAHHNPERLLGFSGSNSLMVLGGYLAARCYVRNLTQMRSFARQFGLLVLCMIPLALIENVTGRMVIPPIIDSLPGLSSHADVNYPPRFGLDRAQVVFAHPIHYGLFASLGVTLVFLTLRDQIPKAMRWGWSGLLIFACFLSFSSGPLLSALMQIGLSSYNWVLRAWAWRWKIIIWGGSSLYIILDLLSDRPLYYLVVRHLAFNSHNAFARRLLMEHATAQIKTTPIFGVGFNGWNVPHWLANTLDNHWLVIGVVFGLPALLPLLYGLFATMNRLSKLDFSNRPDLADARSAYTFTTISIIASLITVAVWAELQSTVFLFFGLGLWLFDVDIRKQALPDAAEAGGRPVSRYTRFGRDPGPAKPKRPVPVPGLARGLERGLERAQARGPKRGQARAGAGTPPAAPHAQAARSQVTRSQPAPDTTGGGDTPTRAAPRRARTPPP